MEKFTQLTGVAAPMPAINIDTDKIFPAIHLRTIKRTGLAKHLFEEIRFRADGSENPDFILNQGPYRQGKIIVARANFRCGSRRGGAPPAFTRFCRTFVLAPKVACIFYTKCFENDLFPNSIPPAQG